MRLRTIPVALPLVLLLAANTPAAADTLEDLQPELSGLHHIYSPCVLRDGDVPRMWTGGWLTQDDPAGYLAIPPGDRHKVAGPDKICVSELRDGVWSGPQSCFAKVGYHVNDPSVIRHPIYRDWLFMYYTALANEDATDERMLLHNHVGFASSIDGGRSWTDHGVVIGQWNGVDAAGAWSPSAIVVGNEIWIYYSTNGSRPQVLRTRFALNGWEPLDTEVVIPWRFAFNRTSLTYALSDMYINVDVLRQDGRLVLFANTPDLRQIVRLSSTDGRHWHGLQVLIRGGTNRVLTPHAEALDAARYRLHFGFETCTPKPVLDGLDPYHHDGSHSIHGWQFRAAAQGSSR